MFKIEGGQEQGSAAYEGMFCGIKNREKVRVGMVVVCPVGVGLD